MAEIPRRLPGWLGNQSVSSSTSASNDRARNAVNDSEEVRVGGSDCSNGAHDIPSSSGTTSTSSTVSHSASAGPLRVVYDREDAVDSCRSSNVDTVSSDGDQQVVSGTSDRSRNEPEDELVDSTSDGAPAGSNAPDSSHDASGSDHNSGEVDSSGLNSNQDEVSSGQPSQARESCFYGTSCYRQNPQHRQEFSHPGDADYVDPSSNTPSAKPVCKYGQGCYRRNPKHRQDYNHDVAPRAARPASLRDGEPSSDEDEFDSGSSEEFSPGDSETDDSFVVSDSFESGSDNEFSPSKDNATNGNNKPSRKQGKRRRKDRDRANKRTKT